MKRKTASAEEVIEHFKPIKHVDVIRVINYMIRTGKLRIIHGSELL